MRSKNRKKFTAQDVIAMLENSEVECGSSDDSIAEDEGDDTAVTVEAGEASDASNKDETDDNGEIFIGRRSRKRPRVISSSDTEEDEEAALAETSYVKSNTDHWTWTSYDDNKIFRPADVPFAGREQILVNLSDNAVPHDFFYLYITPAVIEHMVKETNRYASQFFEAHRDTMKPNSTVHRWHETNSEEMLAFWGMVILMGINYKPRLSMYWSTRDILHTPIFGEVMSRDRFLLLLKFLHFADNSVFDPVGPNRDRLYKIRPLLDMLTDRFKAVYSPKRELCVDESLVLFKGGVSQKQFIRNKRARFGMKIFELSTDNGILLNSMIDYGNMTRDFDETLPNGLLFTEKIPLTLMMDYLKKGHCLFVDNYYTSPVLAHFLLQMQTVLVGPVRCNRKNFPHQLAKLPLERGRSAAYVAENENVMAIKYRAATDQANKQPKVVCMLSTGHSNVSLPTRKKTKDGQVIFKPSCITAYNKSMGGVDLVDKQLESIMFLRKSYKWYRKIAIRLVMQCALNAHKLYTLRGGKKDYLHFLQEVVTELLSHAPRGSGFRRVPVENIERLCGRNHFPGKRTKEGSGKKKSMSKVCRVCYAQGQRTPSGKPIETNWICTGCSTAPGLCVDKNCFKDYHTKLYF